MLDLLPARDSNLHLLQSRYSHPRICSQYAYAENLQGYQSRALGYLGWSCRFRASFGRWSRIKAAHGVEQLGTYLHTLLPQSTTILNVGGS